MSKNNKIENITLGTDPEAFLFNESTGKYVSAIGMIGGSKQSPLPITREGHFIQEDNVSVEFNIPACKTPEEFWKHISFVKEYIQDAIAKPKGLVLKCVPSAIFDKEQLDNEAAQTFGCDPDLNAWTMETNEIDRSKLDPCLRVCGGHIHVGYNSPSEVVSIKIIKAMDIFLAVPAIIVDKDKRRREMYGKAGAFRFKKFGVEHRTLSNFWIDKPELIEWVWQQTMAAIQFVNDGGIETITDQERIIQAINTGDVELAREIVDDYNLSLPPMMGDSVKTTVTTITEETVETVVAENSDEPLEVVRA